MIEMVPEFNSNQVEICLSCFTVNKPTNRPLLIEYKMKRSLFVRFQRYTCKCGWVWANEVQRQHNNFEFNRVLNK